MICPAKSPQELLAEFRSTGRQEPFEEIVRRYAAMVFHVCFQVLKNRHDAEDATQAVFLTLAVQGKTNKEIHSIGPWLQQVAKRLSLDLRKARKRRTAREQSHGIYNANGSNGLALGSGLDGQELRHILSEELNQLSPKYRLPLILHYFGGLSREQMSAELGCKEATLGVRLHRGREMLAARLSQRGVMLTAAGLGMLLSCMVREAVTENLIWSTSHVASQMAAGHPVGGGMISARAMALARNAGNTLAVAKVKAIVASVLIAATAVAAGEVISQVRPLDLKLQGPAGDRLLELLRPKLPHLRSDATSQQPTSTTENTVVRANQNQTVAETKLEMANYSAGPFAPALGADWGGSIPSARWIGGVTSTHIPGILWSSPPQGFAGGFSYASRNAYAVGPLAAPIAKPPGQQPPIPFMPQRVGGATVDAPYATVPQKPPRRPAQDSPPVLRDAPFHMELAPAGQVPPPQIIASAPKLFLEPSPNDERAHPEVVIVASGQPSSIGGGLNSMNTDANAAGQYIVAFNTDSSGAHTGVTSQFEFKGLDELLSPLDGRPRVHQQGPHLQNSPDIPRELSSDSFDGVSTIRMRAGSIKGYGIANRAAELNQNGQVIADGNGQERTLDLSSVGVIKNSIDNSRNGHNGWFAQNKGKLVLPAVAIANGEATWGEDSADPQLDLINSVGLSVDPAVVGSIKLSLLSADRSDYPALPANVKAIGLWQVEPIDFVLGDVDVTVRYDLDLANDLRLSGGLDLWGYDGQWILADAGSIDTTNRLISGHFGGVDYFAVAGSVHTPVHINGTPEPAAMLGLVCAGLILSRRRRI